MTKDGKVRRRKSENRVPMVAGSKEPRIPDDPSQESGDRFQIPGARSSRTCSREVLQSDVPHQEKPGQAPGDRLHFPSVQAPRYPSHKVPEWLQLVKEGRSGEPPDSHNIVVEQPVVDRQRKHLMR